MKLTIIKNSKPKVYEIDYYGYIPTSKSTVFKVVGASVRNLEDKDWDKIILEKD